MTRKTKRILKGAVAGLAGGIAGSLAMNEFQFWWAKAGNKPGHKSSRPAEDPATVKAAGAIARIALHRPLRDHEKKLAGNLVHYAFGTINGALYGAYSETNPKASFCSGALFGFSLFAIADEALVPLLGWSRAPNRYPLNSHIYALASHLVYGAATNAVRATVRAAL